jgi:Tol biopolymer transport system component
VKLRGIAYLFFLYVWALQASADEHIADIRQGTNLSVAVAPTGDRLVIDLLGQLWTLPISGGGAEPLTAAEHARQPRFSPDGSLVVYQRLVAGQWDLWLLDLATRDERPLTATPFDEREPEFTADGTSVVFAANRTGHYCLWSVALKGGVETQLTEEAGNASFPSVSERGLVAYVLETGSETALRVLDANGASTTVHSTSHRISTPTWRPGGGVLVFGEQDGPESHRLRMLLLGEPRVLKPLSNNEDLFDSRVAWLSSAEFVYAADGQLWRRDLTNPARRPVHLFAGLAVEAFSPPTDLLPFDASGARTAFGINGLAESPDGKRAAFTALGDVWVSERGAPQRVTDDAFVDLDPTFWPDGESVVFASERTGQFELWRLALRDQRPTQLTFGALNPHRPAVRPDGKQIAFLETDDVTPGAAARLRVLDFPSGNTTTVATGVINAERPTWSSDGTNLRIHASEANAVRSDLAHVHVELVRDLDIDATADNVLASDRQPKVTWQLPPPAPDYVLQVGRLFDGIRGDYRRHVDIHIRQGRIVAIVGRGVLPAEGTVVALPDATVIPGLIDIHAHEDALAGERLGRAWLAYGVTTVREITTDVPAAIERSEAWASGRLLGPRLLVTPAMGLEASIPGDSRAPIRSYPGIANGFAHSLSQQARTLSIPRVDRKLASVASQGAAGAPYELEVSPGFQAYQDELSRLIASGTVFTPGLGALAGLSAWPSSGAPSTMRRDTAFRTLFTPTEQNRWMLSGDLPAALPALQQTVVRLIRGGGRVAVGSDAPAVPYGLGAHLELALLSAAGLGNDQILRLATAEGALALGLEQQVGTLEEGKLADLVVLDGDPLARISDTLKVLAVVKGGVWYDRGSLLKSP